MGLAVDDWIWIVIGSALAAVIWILWRGRAEPTIEEPSPTSERDEKLLKLFDELK